MTRLVCSCNPVVDTNPSWTVQSGPHAVVGRTRRSPFVGLGRKNSVRRMLQHSKPSDLTLQPSFPAEEDSMNHAALICDVLWFLSLPFSVCCALLCCAVCRASPWCAVLGFCCVLLCGVSCFTVRPRGVTPDRITPPDYRRGTWEPFARPPNSPSLLPHGYPCCHCYYHRWPSQWLREQRRRRR